MQLEEQEKQKAKAQEAVVLPSMNLSGRLEKYLKSTEVQGPVDLLVRLGAHLEHDKDEVKRLKAEYEALRDKHGELSVEARAVGGQLDLAEQRMRGSRRELSTSLKKMDVVVEDIWTYNRKVALGEKPTEAELAKARRGMACFSGLMVFLEKLQKRETERNGEDTDSKDSLELLNRLRRAESLKGTIKEFREEFAAAGLVLLPELFQGTTNIFPGSSAILHKTELALPKDKKESVEEYKKRVDQSRLEMKELWRVLRWDGPLPKDQFRMDAIFSHYAMLHRLSGLEQLVQEELNKVDQNPPELPDELARSEKRKQIYEAAWQQFYHTKDRLNDGLNQLIRMAIKHGFDGEAALTPRQVQALFLLNTAEAKAADEAIQKWEAADGKMQKDSFVECPVCQRVAFGVTQSLEDEAGITARIPSSLLKGKPEALEAEARKYGADYEKAKAFHEKLKQNVEFYRPLFRAVEMFRSDGREHGHSKLGAPDFGQSNLVFSKIKDNFGLPEAFVTRNLVSPTGMDAPAEKINGILSKWVSENEQHPSIGKIRGFAERFSFYYGEVLRSLTNSNTR